MRPVRLLLMLLAVGVSAACGHKIGDSCAVSSDCSSDGTRVCDTFSPGGSCTIEGCDFGTCPDEAVCVRFFPALETDVTCTQDTAATDCQPDEVCTIGGLCAPRSIELRFCMPTCGDNGDCRDGYECRNEALMVKHGGEPVPDPTKATLDENPPSFCAGRKPCASDLECESDEICGRSSRLCEPNASKPQSATSN